MSLSYNKFTDLAPSTQFGKELYFMRGWEGVISITCFENMIDCGHIVHVDVIFHLRVLLRNMTSICLLSLTFRKIRSENVVEYDLGVKDQGHFKINIFKRSSFFQIRTYFFYSRNEKYGNFYVRLNN